MSESSRTQALDDKPQWMQRKERGSFFLLQLMRRISLAFGRRLSRPVVYGIALYFLLAAPAVRKTSRSYLKRVLQRRATWGDLYRHILAFASTIHDRFYLLNDQADLFNIQVFGAGPIAEHHEKGQGLLLFGAHMGSFEVLLAHSRNNHFNSCVAMYPENARQLNRALAAINPQAIADIIPLGQIDSMLAIHHKLNHSAMVGVLADRAAGPDQYLSLPFLGAPARFPTGPFRMAAMLGQPVYFMTGRYCGGNRYEVHFEPLADFTGVARSQRDTAVRDALQQYVATLERHCKAAPYNWFNFFDFWEPAT
ncbi:acyl-CoA synthetase [Simplicispira psychrophila]|uniref:LpxL/LpxP family acyltransferase n=1 Tax=Simplicispira psychrophila TaxID=80882 RepID=UPI00048442DE|nr:acyl-CoA synthetase [Simplicispira psychrophila]